MGWGRRVLRLIHKRVEGPTRARVEYRGVMGVEEYEVLLYEVRLDSLILQDPGYTEAYRYLGVIKLAPEPWRDYCRWHSGPLNERDRPWERLYCNVYADGYCRQHRKSERYLYESCMSLKGERALTACKMLDQVVKTEYAVYLLDSGAQKVKVGSTRLFRLLERIAEQRHLAATLLAVYDSAYKARSAEMRISRLGLASEVSSRASWGRLGMAQAVSRLTLVARKASSILGVRWDGDIFAIRRPIEVVPKPSASSKMAGREVEPHAYWGGLLIVRSRAGGSLVALEERSLLHRDSVEVPLSE